MVEACGLIAKAVLISLFRSFCSDSFEEPENFKA